MTFRIARVVVVFVSLILSLAPLTVAQTPTQTASALPRLVRFGGAAKDLSGSPLTGVVGVTFALYSEQTGGAPLWLETQNVTADSSGHYTALLGSTKPDGLPAELFTSEQARWVGVQVSGQAEQPRVLLVSAPYALKAGDAETIGGLPPSAFVLAAPAAIGSAAASSAAKGTAENVSPATTSDVTTTGGTVNAIPLFSTAINIQNSILTQTGTTQVNVGGTLSLPATAAATATAGKDSQALSLAASAFSSTSSTALNQTFHLQAEPAGNDTTAPSGTLNLLFGEGATAPTETGLKISSKGIFTFAPGQTFPTVTGNETVTGNITSNGSVSAATGFDIGGTPFAFGSVANGNALLGFAGNSTMTGKFNLADGYQALASNTTGSSNTAEGYQALYSNTTGSSNTGLGYKANVGAGNLTNATAIGANSTVTESNALVLGSINGVNGATASTKVGIGIAAPGYLLEVHSPSATIAQMAMVSGGTDAAISVNNTASGGHDYWIDSGSGSAGIGAGNFAIYDHTEFTPRLVVNSSGLVGIGTTTPGAVLDVDGVNQQDVFIKAPESGVGSGLDFFTTGTGGLQWEILDTGSGAAQGANKLNIRNATAGTDVLTILASGNVGIGTTAPQYTLDVHGTMEVSNSATTGTAAGVYGTTASPTGYGVEGVDGASSGGTAGLFQVNTTSATILQGNNGSTTEFKVDSAGDVSAAGAVNAAGAVSGSGFQIGSNHFDYGNYATSSAFLGFAGGPTANASGDTGVGDGALAYDTGGSNAAVGFLALGVNTVGTGNTAIGANAGNTFDSSNLTGGSNTALGYNSLFGTGTLTNATAIGAYSEATESNAIVLGSFAGSAVCQLEGCTNTNVGIGTAAPGFLLEVYAAGASNAQIEMASTGTDAAISVNNKATGGREYWIDSGSGSAGIGAGNFAIYDRTAGATRLAINQNGEVGIGTTSPDNTLSVNGSADKPGGGSWGTFSDGRLKTVNGGFTSGLSQVMKIHPVHYRYKPDNAMGIRDTDEHIGVVAQEVKQVIPEAVTENSKGYLLVNNDPIIWSMLNAIKEQQGEFKQEQAELVKALRQIKQQQSLLRAQSAAMRSLKAEVRETRETLRKVKAQVASAQPELVAAK
jgi:hypothetical protein